jgi:uncharacterized protein YjbI with pentapeptide repeats
MATATKTATYADIVYNRDFILDQIRKGRRGFFKIKFEEGLDLSGLDLRNFSFRVCEMPGAKFDGANLALAQFSRMSLATATGLDSTLGLGLASAYR